MPFVQSRYLDWHYRSRDESLINFSNHYLYQDRLVTFPGPGGPPVIDHVLVKQEPGVDGQEESSNAEVRKVVEVVLDHARKRPRGDLGCDHHGYSAHGPGASRSRPRTGEMPGAA